MTVKISFVPDKTYYKEAYYELVRFKKWEPFIGIFLMAVGGAIYWYDNYAKTISTGLVVAGLIEFFKCFYEKNKWVKERMKSAVSGQVIEMEFYDESIKHVGPFSQGEIKWEGLKEIRKTDKGIVLKIDTGVSIYLPDTLFENKEHIAFILSKKPKEDFKLDYDNL